MVSKLYEKHNYLNKDIDYINNMSIIEYDMKNAGINILRHNNIISQSEYDKLNELPKLEKNILVGKFLKNNKDINNFLINEFVNVRKELFELNDIDDSSVLSIKKDAIYLVDKVLHTTKLNDFYEFKSKNEYTSYININGKEHYFNDFSGVLDVKGYLTGVKERQDQYMFKFLRNILKNNSFKNKDRVFIDLIEFKDDFINCRLENEYYYDLYLGSYIFKLNTILMKLDNIDEELKLLCDKSSNLSFILSLINLIL